MMTEHGDISNELRVFFFEGGEKTSRRPAERERTEGERPVSGPKSSDGKPCSGVRGDQKVSTDLPYTMRRVRMNRRGEDAVWNVFSTEPDKKE